MTRYILGTGDHVYEAIHPFGNLPAGFTFDNVSHIAADSSGRVYAYRRGNPPVMVFDGDGALVDTWGDDQILDAHGIFITPDDEIYLVDRDAHEVIKFDTTGKVLMRLGTRETPALQQPFNHPADIAIARNGDIFVADGYGNSRVHRFDAKGSLIKSWGSRGAGPGQFTTPHGIWADDRDRVYVCDRENNRVQMFSIEGEYICEWGDFFHPMDVFVDEEGTVYVTDQVPRITMLSADGELIARGRTPYNGHGMWIDLNGNIYLAGNEAGITKLAKQA